MESSEVLRNEIRQSKSIKNCFEKQSWYWIWAQKNANTLKDLYSDLAGNLVRKLPVAFNKFNNNLAKQYYMNIEKNCHNFELCNATLDSIRNILACWETSKSPGLDGISSKFLKGFGEVLTLTLACDLVNLSVKQYLFPDQYKIPKQKSLFKKGSKSDPIITGSCHCSCCIQDNREKQSYSDARICG